ncbi:alpha/beta fold hydrolase [Pseudoalteromonas luteoviolacea]|uniref:alpha/beta fold hydrolase n=1 Tax=Pseudoalteromonas luteoviolacea TaxID=43657 RepID=UPI00114D4F17|nr:alpha/beta hydrolase [Pseudoalteromonas luteoviolacea]TQF71160.1 alpha/beta hydrolase [Pseudoalteromonas luteoviolacea]
MSSKIYFSDSNSKKSMSYLVTRGVSSLMAKVAPNTSMKATRKLLLTPSASRKQVPLPESMRTRKLDSQYGAINVVEAGEGPTVIFTHGWSGSVTQFYPLMQKLVEKGHKVVGFDHYGHGKSEGRFANLPLFIKGLKTVMSAYDDHNVKGIVSHSMGTIGALNATHDARHVLIAPTFDFYNSFQQRILSTGLANQLFEKLLNEVETEHGMAFKELQPELHMEKQGQLLVVHDKDDKYAPYSHTQEQVGLHEHASLSTTSGQGHGRIINSAQTWQAVEQLVGI